MTSRRGVRRRATQKKSPANMSSMLSKYLTTSTTTRHFPLPSQGLSYEAVCTSYAQVSFLNGVGSNGLVIPENPNRALSQFGGFVLSPNASFASYKQLFDEVRVKAIIVEYQPLSTSALSLGNNSAQFVALCDYDSELSAGVLTTPLQALQYNTAKLVSLASEHQMVFKPVVNRSFTTWFSTTDTSARGCVYYYLNTSAGGTFNAGGLVIKHVLEFRNVIA